MTDKRDEGLSDLELDAVTGAGHKNWVMIESMSSPIFRSIPQSPSSSDVVPTETPSMNYAKIEWA